MYGPKGPFLLRYGSHDTRHIDFPRVDGLSTDTPGFGASQYYLTSIYLCRISTLFIFYYIFYTHITNMPIKFLESFLRKLWCFMLISITHASLVLQTFLF